jgi:thiol-disulfide isomerase/thioredoxin
MATLKEKFGKWKETRSTWQKTGDVLFWLLLVLLVLPGPRKVIVTNVNRVMLQVKNPGIKSEDKQVVLSERDYSWLLTDANGLPQTLSDHNGSVIFLNFWATWCPPCVAELPEIQKAYEKHGDKVVFLLVANQEPSVVKAFMEKHGYNLPVLYPGTVPPEVFNSRSIPTTYIISRDGRIVTKKTGAVNWDSRATDRIFEQLLR